MMEKDFRAALASAPDAHSRMATIVKQFQYTGVIRPSESVVAIYYIAEALASMLGESK